MERKQSKVPHFLIVTYPAQGHINPCLRLARRLALLSPAGTTITFSTALSAHRLMFPSSPDLPVVRNGPISFIPYSNGCDTAVFDSRIHDPDHHLHQLRRHGSVTLSSIITSSPIPITCIIHSSFLTWVPDLAASLRIPAFLFWIQSATAFAAYWHYFHCFTAAISAAAFDPSSPIKLPLLSPMHARDLPSFLAITSADHPDARLLPHLKEGFVRWPKLVNVLANTTEGLEAGAVESVAAAGVRIVGVGPLVGEERWEASLFEEDEDWERHIEWLDKQEQRSVVYVSFGSMAVVSEKEVKEIGRGLRKTRRPFFWVVKKHGSCEFLKSMEEEGKGKIVGWCRQERVLRHGAVGCFVTHCGWNSTLEGIASGVPGVGVPRWTDQTTNAWLMESEWGTGVRAVVEEGGVVAAEEVARCVELVMGGGGIGEEMRKKVEEWKEKVREAMEEGGPSDRNLRAFVEDQMLCKYDCK